MRGSRTRRIGGPGPDCGGFPLSPGVGAGSWTSWCEDQPLGGGSATCGATAVVEDLVAPISTIIDPLDQAVFSSDPMTGVAELAITGEASDDGWGIESVELLIDGGTIPNGAKYFPPYVWSGAFPPGGYILQLVATDVAGNSSMSEPVHVGVDQDAPMPEPEPEPEPETETGADADTGETGTGDPALDGDSGCACSGPSREPGLGGLGGLGGLAMLLLGGLALRRRQPPLRAK